MKYSTLIFSFVVNFTLLTISVIQAQSISLQEDYAGEYDDQNVPDIIEFDKYSLKYRFKLPAYVSINSESAAYFDSFENYFDYKYIGFGLGTLLTYIRGFKLMLAIVLKKHLNVISE